MSLHNRRRSAFTVVELLICCAVIGMLAGLLLPAVSRSREAARRLECTHRLHQIGLALATHHDCRGGLPAGWTRDRTGESAFGWCLQLLPFAENTALFDSARQTRPLGDAANAEVCRSPLPWAICPSDVQEPLFALYEETGEHAVGGQRSDNILLWLASANYVAVFGARDPDDVPGPTGDGVFIEGRSIRLAELERGLSNTLLVGERTASKLPSAWLGFAARGEDAASRVTGVANFGPNRDDVDESEFASRHPGCANFLWADGRVEPMSDAIDSTVYRRLATRGQNAN
jgi:prepilin-type processing-associated H-X9-DG protein